MKTKNIIEQIKNTPESIEFSEVIAAIDHDYKYTATAFTNGQQHNAAGSNEGSCKILAFAKLQSLDKTETLALFGHYYREEVLLNPDADSHQNIRQFMKHGWQGVSFENNALEYKAGQ